MHLVPVDHCADGIYAYARRTCDSADQVLTPGVFEASGANCMVLVFHFSGYGYDINGLPSGLIDSLCAWRCRDPQRRLLVVFHELFARQPPWRKGFWLAPLQRRLLRRLIGCCDSGLSTLELHSRWLHRNGLKPFATHPVPSNVGETSEPLPLHLRSRQLVVFGGRSQRQAAYSALERHTGLLNRIGVTAIHDVGSPLSHTINLPGLSVVCHGLLPEVEVASLLSCSQLAAVSYPLSFLAKSGIFAAICAHGCLPLVINAGLISAAEADGLSAGHQFVTPSWLQTHPDLRAAQPIATAAWQWYQPHQINEQHRLFQAWLTAQC